MITDTSKTAGKKLETPRSAKVLNNDGTISTAWGDYFRDRDKIASTNAWVVGDYRASVAQLTDDWLLCDGSDVAIADYPELFALIGTITGTGTGSPMFLLPTIPGVYADANPEPAGPPVLNWYIKAL